MKKLALAIMVVILLSVVAPICQAQEIRYVNTASSTGGDGTSNATTGDHRAYPTLREAVVALPDTLASPYLILCDGSGGADTLSVTGLHFDQVTSSSNYLKITTVGAQRHKGVYDSNIYRLEVTNDNGIYNNIPCHIRIDGIQVKITATGGGDYIGIKATNANQTANDIDCRISNCIVWGVNTSGAITGITSRPPGAGASGSAYIYNNIVYGCRQGIESDYAGVYVYNNTVYGCIYGMVADAPFVASNNIVASCDLAFISGFGAASDYNATTAEAAPGAHSRVSQTFSFANAGAGDFRLLSTDAGAKDYANSTLVGSLFSTDIEGQTRSGSWDIGADEYVPPAIGGGASLMLGA